MERPVMYVREESSVQKVQRKAKIALKVAFFFLTQKYDLKKEIMLRVLVPT